MEALSKFSVHFRFFFFFFFLPESEWVFSAYVFGVVFFFYKSHSQILIRLKDNVLTIPRFQSLPASLPAPQRPALPSQNPTISALLSQTLLPLYF